MSQADARETGQGPAERGPDRSRNTFWALLLLDVMMGLGVLVQLRAGRGAGQAFGPLQAPALLWALAVSAYAFFAWRRPAQGPQPAAGSTTDPRTGLFTMDHLKSCLECERQRAQDSGVSAAVVYLDLANLDRVNHVFGFTVGDIVLKALARLMAEGVRPGDILGRVAGDEFMIIMPETTLAEALPVAESVRQAVADYRLDLGKKGVIDFMQCYAGMASFPLDGRSAEEVAAAARERIGAPRGDAAVLQPA
jgi:diguanylate cyclase (GGDEF)-like protein